MCINTRNTTLENLNMSRQNCQVKDLKVDYGCQDPCADFLDRLSSLFATEGRISIEHFNPQSCCAMQPLKCVGHAFQVTNSFQYLAAMRDEEFARRAIVHLLLLQNEKLNIIPSEGENQCTPLDVAAAYLRCDTLEFLLDIGAVWIPYSNPLVLAIGSTPIALKVMKKLLDAGVSTKHCVNVARRAGQEPFRLLLEERCSREKYYKHSFYNELRCTMDRAVDEHDLSAIREILCYNRKMCQMYPAGKQDEFYLDVVSVMSAIERFTTLERFKEILDLALEFNVDLNFFYIKSLLLRALVRRRFRTACLLIEKGADVNYLVRCTIDLDPEFTLYRQNCALNSFEPDEYVIWLERRFNLTGFNLMLLGCGLDVSNIYIDEDDIEPGHSVFGQNLSPSDDDDGGCALRAWMFQMIQRKESGHESLKKVAGLHVVHVDGQYIG